MAKVTSQALHKFVKNTIENMSLEQTWCGSAFQTRAPVIGKARLPTADHNARQKFSENDATEQMW